MYPYLQPEQKESAVGIDPIMGVLVKFITNVHATSPPIDIPSGTNAPPPKEKEEEEEGRAEVKR